MMGLNLEHRMGYLDFNKGGADARTRFLGNLSGYIYIWYL